MSPRDWKEYVESEGRYYVQTFSGEDGSLVDVDDASPQEYYEWLDEKRRRLSALDPGEVHAIPLNEFLRYTPDRPAFLVEPFLPSGGLGLIHALPEMGKSLLAMTLAKAVVNGESFLGRFPCRKGRVVFVENDMPPFLFHDRLLKHGIDTADILVVTGQSAKPAYATPADTPWVQRVRAFGAELIIIDTLRQVHDLNEDKSDVPTKVYSSCRRLFGAEPALMFIHHDRKPYPGQENSARGSGAWIADVDCGLQIQRKELSWSKARCCEKPDPLWLRINPKNLLIEASATPEDMAAEYHREHPDATAAQIARYVIEATGCSRATAYRRAKQLLGTEDD